MLDEKNQTANNALSIVDPRKNPSIEQENNMMNEI